MSGRFLSIFLIAFLMQTPTDCFSGASGALSGLPGAYNAGDDATLTAAERSAKSKERDREYQAAKDRILSRDALAKNPLDHAEIDKAIQADQTHRGYKLVKAAMLRAEGKDAEASSLESEVYAMFATEGTFIPLGVNRFYHAGLAGVQDKLVSNLPEGATKKRMEEEMCANVRAAWKAGAQFNSSETGAYRNDLYDRRCGGRGNFAP